ncbi:MFS general substrate transporter [Tuber magnatum]|uniref:MFS general substrate transporter n=1 Tax=Tuber magnatum TaxID=42249 RepID=A0A317SLU4_9PEZI|nr:MFS general substrate transporter [Tuber magnatum]
MAELKDLERVVSESGGSRSSGEEVESEAGGKEDSEEKLGEQKEDEALIDQDIVDWDGPEDPENPMNWPKWRKVATVGIVSAITFVTPLTSSMLALGVPQLLHDFHSTNLQLGSFVVSIYVLGFAFGPLVLAPASELWGWQIVYNISNLGFLLCTIGCAEARRLGMLAAFRFLAGAFGAAPLTIGGGSVTDVFAVQERGVAMAILIFGPLLGPVIGPVGSGFLIEAAGWRSVFWVLAAASAVITLATFTFLNETYAPRILERKAASLRKSTGNPRRRSKLSSQLPQRQVFTRALVRPLKMLFLSSIVLALSVFVAIVYGYLYLLLTTFPMVFQETYGFTAGTSGLTYIGFGVGSLVGLLTCGALSDRILNSRSAVSGETKPEYRLVPVVYASVCTPIGLFWYGWSGHEKMHYLVPIAGTMFVGAGIIGSFIPVLTYMVDAFTVYAASALAANTVLRSILGAVLPLAGPRMYGALGLGWGNSLLALIAVAMVPIPILFERYGERIRKRWVQL